MDRPPYVIIARVQWGSLRTLKVPESAVPRLTGHGWLVVARDSLVAAEAPGPRPQTWPWQRNPNRTGDDGA